MKAYLSLAAEVLRIVWVVLAFFAHFEKEYQLAAFMWCTLWLFSDFRPRYEVYPKPSVTSVTHSEKP